MSDDVMAAFDRAVRDAMVSGMAIGLVVGMALGLLAAAVVVLW